MKQLDAYIQSGPPYPLAGETYEQYLNRQDLLGHGFVYRELVSRYSWVSYRKRLPPRDLWQRMAMTLAAANELRKWWLDEGGSGLRLFAAYRPVGGATRSQHKKNAALDLDLLRGDWDKKELWYRVAARFWATYALWTRMGLGFYTSRYGQGGIRIHMDTLYYHRNWQNVPSIKPWHVNGKHHTLAEKLVLDQGLELPGLDTWK